MKRLSCSTSADVIHWGKAERGAIHKTPLQARRRTPARINSMSRFLMPYRMSTARLLCSIIAFSGNKLTHIGSTDTHSQLTFPTITDTVAYRRGYFYRLPGPEKNPTPIALLQVTANMQRANRNSNPKPQTPFLVRPGNQSVPRLFCSKQDCWVALCPTPPHS